MSAVGCGMKAREASHMSTSIPVTSPATIISVIWSTAPLLPAIGRASMKNFLQHTHTHTHTHDNNNNEKFVKREYVT